MEAIERFLRFCKTELKIDESKLFTAADLYCTSNMVKVVSGLTEFAQAARDRNDAMRSGRGVVSLPRQQNLSYSQLQAGPQDAIHAAVKSLQPQLNTIIWWPNTEPLPHA